MSKEKVTPESLALGLFPTLEDLGFDIQENPNAKQAFAEWVRALMQNWRQGTVGVKDRSMVSYTNKKPFKQKGTGRARAGSARSPLWRGGGVVFGPQKRTKKLSITKETKKNVLAQLLRNFIEAKKVVIADWIFSKEQPKTKLASSLLKNLNLTDKKVVLLLSRNDFLTYASFINLPSVQILLFDQLNAYDLANADCWLILKKDSDAFKEAVAQWN